LQELFFAGYVERRNNGARSDEIGEQHGSFNGPASRSDGR
jgi:hypothetical protein